MIAETFISGTGLLYRLDPRPKLILLMAAVFFFLAEASVLLMLCMLSAVMLLSAAGPGLKKIIVPVKSILPILILTVILTPPFNNDGDAVITFFSRTVVSVPGLFLTARLLLRFTGITTVFFLFFSTTKTDHFILALQDFGLPYKAALTVTISLRYIPYMFSTYHRISDAHKLRTAGFENNAAGGKRGKKNSFGMRIKKLSPILISVLINAVKNIPSLAMALDSKGLGRANPRTSCRKLQSWRSITLQVFFSLVTAAALIIFSIGF